MDNDEIFRFLMQDDQIKNKYENQSMLMAIVTILEDKEIISPFEFDMYLKNSKKVIKDKMIKDTSKGKKEYIEIRKWLEDKSK